MIKNKVFSHSFAISLAIAICSHLVVLFFVKKNDHLASNISSLHSFQPRKIDHLEVISQTELEQIKKVGIKNGLKEKYLKPDIAELPKSQKSPTSGLSLDNLAPAIEQIPKETTAKSKVANTTTNFPTPTLRTSSNDQAGHFYFNPKKEKSISRNQEQDNLKQDTVKNILVNSSNPVAQKLSNFEIRYERPEGVSEDQLNSDEKAYYSFFKRSYANYLTKLYATYEKVSVNRPALEKAFNNKHLLIGRIDYDDKGNIVTVKILKSSEDDDVHYFFEETLKQLNLPNPPKSFIKNKKQFSTYYQIQIN